MRNFQHLGTLDPVPILLELQRQPELWDRNGARRSYACTPHADTSDIWVRWHRDDATDDGEPHTLEFLPPWSALPALRLVVFNLMARTQAVALGGILITRIPPSGRVLPHRDDGWHANWFNTKVYCVLQSNPECINRAEAETVTMQAGSAWLFRNTVTHDVINDGPDDRISLIVCMRCES